MLLAEITRFSKTVLGCDKLTTNKFHRQLDQCY